MHNPFENKVSAKSLALTFENKTPVLAEPTSIPERIAALRKQADDLQNKLENDLEKIWAFFDRKDANEYTSKKMLSYSLLKHVDSVRFSKKEWGDKQRNFNLGRAFEDMLTDNLDVAEFPNLETDDFKNLQRMCEYAKKNSWIKVFLSDCEMQKEFIGEIKGYKFKAKADFYNRECDYIGDLKTTSAQTLTAFQKACIDFGYYTQGVIYSSLAGTESLEDFYIIVGVSKKTEAVFTISMNESDCELGYKELDRLLENLAYYGIAEQFKV